MQAFPRLLLFANLVFKLSSLVHAVLVNVTIGDASPDPLTGFSIVYQPPTVWKKGPSCQDCNANLDPTQTTDGTWHESLFSPLSGSTDAVNQVASATARFNGTAVYVVCVLARSTAARRGTTDVIFLIDGETVGTFAYDPPGSEGFDYDQIVYSNNSLTPGLHQLTIQNGQTNGRIDSFLMLDSIIYSLDDGKPASVPTPPNEEPKKPLPVILGAVFGAVALTAFGLLLCVFRHKRRKQETKLGLSHTPLMSLTMNSTPTPPQMWDGETQLAPGTGSHLPTHFLHSTSTPIASTPHHIVPPPQGFNVLTANATRFSPAVESHNNTLTSTSQSQRHPPTQHVNYSNQYQVHETHPQRLESDTTFPPTSLIEFSPTTSSSNVSAFAPGRNRSMASRSIMSDAPPAYELESSSMPLSSLSLTINTDSNSNSNLSESVVGSSSSGSARPQMGRLSVVNASVAGTAGDSMDNNRRRSRSGLGRPLPIPGPSHDTYPPEKMDPRES